MHSKCLHCNVDLTNLTNKLINQFNVQFLALQCRYPRVVCLVLFIVINLQKYEEKLSTIMIMVGVMTTIIMKTMIISIVPKIFQNLT